MEAAGFNGADLPTTPTNSTDPTDPTQTTIVSFPTLYIVIIMFFGLAVVPIVFKRFKKN